jgi:hypothetical protein
MRLLPRIPRSSALARVLPRVGMLAGTSDHSRLPGHRRPARGMHMVCPRCHADGGTVTSHRNDWECQSCRRSYLVPCPTCYPNYRPRR